MRRLYLLVAVAGCGAKLAEDPTGVQHVVDASPSEDAHLTIDAAVAPPDARPCTGGQASAVGPGGECFIYVAGPATWDQAKAGCIAMNAQLAILDTAAKDTFAEALVTTDVFIGANDNAVESSFVWVDGTPVVFTNWHAGEPNNGGGGGYSENCVVVAGARVGKGWDDRPCAPTTAVPNAGSYGYLCDF